MNDINETTKTFPRTLEEAFPKEHPWHFEAIHAPESDPDYFWDSIMYLVGAFGLGLVVGLIVTGN
jgi:hypothetical protein